ncbi:MAG: flagellar hook basal-body protein [Polyangiaceae bacterium]
MAKGVYAALSGAVAANTALETTAQNLANCSTAGYAKLRPVFREVLAQQAPTQARGAGPVITNRYTAVSGTVLDSAPGEVEVTGEPLDVALPEGVYLAVNTPAGERYTRAGDIRLTPDGTLTVAGGTLAGEDGSPLRAEPDAELTFTKDGQLLAGEDPVGRVKLVRFDEPRGLTPEGINLFASSQASGNATPASGEIRVGELERSNAAPVGAMTELITTTRLFDAFQRAIESFRDADRKAASMPAP